MCDVAEIAHVRSQGVAVLSREPSFWWLHNLLLPAARGIFASKDFSRTAVLEEVLLRRLCLRTLFRDCSYHFHVYPSACIHQS